MATQPSKLHNNHEAKDYFSLGPNFVITVNDPKPNADSSAVFSKYAFTKENNHLHTGTYALSNAIA